MKTTQGNMQTCKQHHKASRKECCLDHGFGNREDSLTAQGDEGDGKGGLGRPSGDQGLK